MTSGIVPRSGSASRAGGRRDGQPSRRGDAARIGSDRLELAAHRAPPPPLDVADLAIARAAIGVRPAASASRPVRASTTARRSRTARARIGHGLSDRGGGSRRVLVGRCRPARGRASIPTAGRSPSGTAGASVRHAAAAPSWAV
ncbi:MAG: hypothetical protein E6J91_27460 [Deltaproteobacteria bacterium]|nr:MAG: hypothetical protein E6J91_27460 [Deltaproteobacteria bacterium]